MAQQQPQQPQMNLPEDFERNQLLTSLAPFVQSHRVICQNDGVCALGIKILLKPNRLPHEEVVPYDVVVKFWPEERCTSCAEQLLAASRATKLLDGRSTAHELLSCRVLRHGNVSISRYAGRSLEDLLSSGDLQKKYNRPELVEMFLQKLAADLLIELKQLEGVGLTFRDIKPDNIVWDEELNRFRLIDYGLAIPLDGSHVFSGMSPLYFPADLTAKNPQTGLPYFTSEHGQRIQSTAISQSRAGSLDSNLLGLTLLKLITAWYNIQVPVSYEDSRYHVSADETAAAGNMQRLQQLWISKALQFARDYRRFMADKQRLRSLLADTHISASAVDFLLALLEVDPQQRPSVREAMILPWVKGSVQLRQCERAAVAMIEKEQAIAAHYAGFGAALEWAIQQREAQQQLEEAVLRQSLQLSQQQAAYLQQQVQVLAQQNLMLQQQLAYATKPVSAAPGALLDRLALAEADAANALQSCLQQKEIITVLEEKVASHQQNEGLMFNTILQLQQQLAALEQQQQVYTEPMTASATVVSAAGGSSSPDTIPNQQLPDNAERICISESLQQHDTEAQQSQVSEQHPGMPTEQEAVNDKEGQEQQQLQDTNSCRSVAEAYGCDANSSNDNSSDDSAPVDGEVSSSQIKSTARVNSRSTSQRSSCDGNALVPGTPVINEEDTNSNNNQSNTFNTFASYHQVFAEGSQETAAAGRHTPAVVDVAGVEPLPPCSNQSIPPLAAIMAETPSPNGLAPESTAAEFTTAADAALLECAVVDGAPDWTGISTKHVADGVADAGGVSASIFSAFAGVVRASVGLLLKPVIHF